MPTQTAEDVKERLYTTLWAAGVRMRNALKRAGVLGALDGLLEGVAPRVIPPPASATDARLPFDLTLAILPDHPASRNFLAGVYEVEVTRLLPRLLARGMTVIDLGAHIGYYTLLASRLVAPEGRVYAFEPDPFVLPWLRENIARNECRNVVVVEQAAAEHTGHAPFAGGAHSHWGAFAWTTAADDGMTVRTVSLDEFLGSEGWPPVHLVKMDIEGAEHRALLGMTGLCRRNRALRLIMESNRQAMRRAGVTPAILAETLEALGFEHGYIIEQRLRPFAVAQAFPTSRAIHNLLLTRGAVDLTTCPDAPATADLSGMR